jgi:hypothetical protein
VFVQIRTVPDYSRPNRSTEAITAESGCVIEDESAAEKKTEIQTWRSQR